MNYLPAHARRLPGACFATLLAVSTLPLTAQSQPGPATEKDEEIIQLSPFEISVEQDVGYRPSSSVSATRMNVPIKDLPITLNAFTQEFIDDQKARSMADIVRFAPGVTNSNPEFNGGNAVFAIRGFNTTTTLRNGFTGPTVLDPVNVSRVEVVKGPSSLLYGQIQPGGIVNYVTKKPLAKQASSFTQSVGTDEFYRTEADVTGSVGKVGSPLLYRVVGAYDHAPEFRHPSEKTSSVIAPSLTWQIGKKTKITAEYEEYRLRETPPVLTAQFYNRTLPAPTGTISAGPVDESLGLPDDFNAASDGDFRHSDTTSWVLDGQTEVLGFNLRAVYSHVEQQVDHFLTASLAGTSLTSPTVPRRGRLQVAASEDDSYQFEATRHLTFNGGTLRFLAGYQYAERPEYNSQATLPAGQIPPTWDLRNPATWNRSINFGVSNLVLNSDTRIDNERDGLYGVLHASLLDDKFHVLGGVRRSTIETITTNLMNNTQFGQLKVSQTSPQAGVMFRPIPAVSLFASYSESFFPIGGARRVNSVPVGPFDPSIGKGYDAGVKLSFADGRLTANVSVFTLENTGIVRSVVTGLDSGNNPLFTDEQTGVDASEGVEFDMLWAPNQQWQILATYAYLDAHVKSNTQRPDLVGTQRPNTVENTANLWVKHVFKGRLKGLSLAGGVSYTGPRFSTLIYSFDEYYLADFLAAYTWGSGKIRYTADLSVKNALDETYYQSNALAYGYPFHAAASFRISF
jgi:iron complex outermembrane receptor protein